MEASQQNGQLSSSSSSSPSHFQTSRQRFEMKVVKATPDDRCKAFITGATTTATTAPPNTTTPTTPSTLSIPSSAIISPNIIARLTSPSPLSSSPRSPKIKRKPKKIKPRPVCTVCGKSFSKPANLRAHERIHTGEKRYECTVCSRKFVWKSSLNFHLRTSHKSCFEQTQRAADVDEKNKIVIRNAVGPSTSPPKSTSCTPSPSPSNAVNRAKVNLSNNANTPNHAGGFAHQCSSPFTATCSTATAHTADDKAPQSILQTPSLPRTVREDWAMKDSMPLPPPLPVPTLRSPSIPIPNSPMTPTSNLSRIVSPEDHDYQFQGTPLRLPMTSTYEPEQKGDDVITNAFHTRSNPEHIEQYQMSHSQQRLKQNQHEPQQPISVETGDPNRNHVNHEGVNYDYNALNEGTGVADQPSVVYEGPSPMSISDNHLDEGRNHSFNMLCEQSKIPIIEVTSIFETNPIDSENFSSDEDIENTIGFRHEENRMKDENVEEIMSDHAETSLCNASNININSTPNYSNNDDDSSGTNNCRRDNSDNNTNNSDMNIVKKDPEEFELISLAPITAGSSEAQDMILERIDTDFIEEISKEESTFFDYLLLSLPSSS